MAKKRVIHYDDMQVFGGINLCGVRGTWHGTSLVTEVTCKGCRDRLTYWLIRNRKVKGVEKVFAPNAKLSTHYSRVRG